jgi:hypothetical protein
MSENETSGQGTETEDTATTNTSGNGKPKGQGVNQLHFAVFYTVLTIALIAICFKYFDPSNGPAYGASLRISAVSMQSIVLWFISALGFTAALNGLKCDLYKEINEENNVAVALLVGFAWLALAIVIHG